MLGLLHRLSSIHNRNQNLLTPWTNVGRLEICVPSLFAHGRMKKRALGETDRQANRIFMIRPAKPEANFLGGAEKLKMYEDA